MNRVRKHIPPNIDSVEPAVLTKIPRQVCENMIGQYTVLAMRHDLLEGKELADIFLRRATLFSCVENHEGALADAQQSINLRQDQGAAYYRAGHACIKLQDAQKALNYFREGMKYSSSPQLTSAFNVAMESLLAQSNSSGLL